MRLAIGVEYDGSRYSGWQFQPHAPSIQEGLNKALSFVASSDINCVGAGRTDSGVHATGQVAHFDAPVYREPHAWLMGVNSYLPDDICALWVQPVEDNFHARFTAIGRTYFYKILNRKVRSPLSRDRSWWIHKELDARSMQLAAECLIGENDFSAFRASSCQSHSPFRNLSTLKVVRDREYIHIVCSANSFLHHMVRNIVGSLVRVGNGDADLNWIKEVLESRDRRLSGITAPASGLTLTHIDYPSGILDN
ncbi:MAG: tRNA pseudouridine(38-40) synthase TruA [Pseudomonadota bacterium]|nr:tRNA pseudouridine(38-40) synthase TruA [Pseudomonadota bacterium]